MPAKVTKNPVNNYKGWLQLGETSCCNFPGRCWGEVCGRRTDTIKHPPWRRGNAFWIKDLVILHQHHILCAPFACSLPQPHPGQHWTNSGAVKAKLLQSAFFLRKIRAFGYGIFWTLGFGKGRSCSVVSRMKLSICYIPCSLTSVSSTVYLVCNIYYEYWNSRHLEKWSGISDNFSQT